MIKKLILTTGCPGSGKSTLVQNWMNEEMVRYDEDGAYYTGFKYGDMALYHSTDKYWFRPDGRYDFNFKLLTEAHDWNKNQVEFSMKGELMYVIVDNTNLTWKEIEPYVRMAKKHGYVVEIWESDAEWRYDAEELAKRNTHGVPLETIQKMLARKESVESLREKVKEFMNG